MVTMITEYIQHDTIISVLTCFPAPYHRMVQYVKTHLYTAKVVGLQYKKGRKPRPNKLYP